MLWSRQPILISNPVSDGAFVERVGDIAAVSGTAYALQVALRAYYPDAVVRDRDLAGEATTWYVYRDGHWKPS